MKPRLLAFFPALLALFAALLALPAMGEPGTTLQMDFSNPGLVPSQWTLTLHPDGTGHFHADRGIQADSANRGRTIETTQVDRDINVSRDFAQYVFETVHRRKLLNVGCESNLKVAFQGVKKLHYSGPDGQGGCQFNYSRDKEIQELGEALVAVGSTILEGERLALLRQYDPLGLDEEIQYIGEAMQDGRLAQIGVIRDILTKLKDDPAILDRVRKRARELLAKADR